jgi:hypothetical protein
LYKDPENTDGADFSEGQDPSGAPVEVSPAAEAFYSGALKRITRLMPVLAVLFAAVAWIRFGGMVAAGVALGCAIAYLNFHWLKRVVFALADRVTESGNPKSGKGIVFRFLFRYGLIAIGCYAIFKVSEVALFGLLAGLFLPVAAITCEAVYEGYVALRRGL